MIGSRRIAVQAAKIALAPLLALAVLGAANPSARFEKDSHSMMCICGCEELLGECNHVSCPNSGAMRAELAAGIAAGKSDDAILRQFQQEYGPVVLAAPMFTPFNRFAWILPPVALLAGIVLVLFLVRRWKAPAPAVRRLSPNQEAIRERIRRETQL